MELQDKLTVLADAAKYDVACTSCGPGRKAEKGKLGSTEAAGICHSFSADGRCITLLKVLLSNACSYNCTYCVNRTSNDIPRATFTARELAELTIGFYRRNYIEGLFLSSGILGTPDYTTERMCEVLYLLREEYGFNGYIHAKAIPGTSEELLVRLGVLADRMSLNIELPSEASLKALAPDKGAHSILNPMSFVRDGIHANYQDKRLSTVRRTRFVPAGQSTQMIVGASPESDYQILNLSASLYRSLEMRRVFFSAYIPVNSSPLLPSGREVPLLREHRLYQADWLLRFYGFDVTEIISAEQPFLDPLLDPKCFWALNHLEEFPMEINRAPYESLLRIPGIGVRGAKRILAARRERRLNFDDLKRLNITLKRAQHFITCNGNYTKGLIFDPIAIYDRLTKTAKARLARDAIEGQLSLFEADTKTAARGAQAWDASNGDSTSSSAQNLGVANGGASSLSTSSLSTSSLSASEQNALIP